MASTGRVLDIARRAMAAQQVAMDTVGHNIANVNTEGYSRQRVSLTPSEPTFTANGFIGQGVTVESIHRVHDSFVERQIRSEYQSLEQWNNRETFLTELESIYNEPSDTGLSALMSDFWDSWSALSADPQNGSARETVRQVGKHVSSTLNSLYKRLEDFQSDLDEELKVKITEANSYLRQIGNLNNNIIASENNGGTANEYRDRRDQAIKELSGLLNIQTVQRDDGQVTVTLGGQILVERNQVYELGIDEVSNGESVVSVPTWSKNGEPIEIRNGEIYSILQIRDEDIQDEFENIDAIAMALVETINSVHETGYGSDGTTGNQFFDASTTGARDIALDDNVLSDLSKIAASNNGDLGDGSIALSIAQLQEEKVMSNGTQTIDDYYASSIGNLGVRAKEARYMRENQEMMVQQLENQKAAVSGVSLDEEMTLMMQYQTAYQAAARLINTINEMMDTIIQMV